MQFFTSLLTKSSYQRGIIVFIIAFVLGFYFFDGIEKLRSIRTNLTLQHQNEAFKTSEEYTKLLAELNILRNQIKEQQEVLNQSLEDISKESEMVKSIQDTIPEYPTIESVPAWFEYSIEPNQNIEDVASYFKTSVSVLEEKNINKSLSPGNTIQVPDIFVTWKNIIVKTTDTWANLEKTYQISQIDLKRANKTERLVADSVIRVPEIPTNEANAQASE